MKRIIVTGGAGAIGLHLVRKLLDEGNYVYIVDNYCRSERDQEVINLVSNACCEEIIIDLCDRSQYDKLPDNIDYIYHMAAFNGTQNFYEIPFTVLKNSTLPAIYLIEKYAQSDISRFIYAAGSEGYASTVSMFDWPVPTDEKVPLCFDDPTNVRWSYAISKVHGEIACMSASQEHNMPITVVRYHNVFGTRMGDKHVIPDFLDRVENNEYELHGYEDTRSFIYVTDAVDATILCAESDNTTNEIINIGGSEEISMLELGERILEILEIDENIKCNPSPLGSVKRRCPDLQKLIALVNYKPKISLNEGLKKIIDYRKINSTT